MLHINHGHILVLWMVLISGSALAADRPNVIVIVADDLGWNDVGFHGSDQIPTPNLDRLAHQGVILNNYYVHMLCTPTRAALMTGRYSIHTDDSHRALAVRIFESKCIRLAQCMMRYPIMGSEPYGLGLHEKILPQYLKELGYQNHIVGKWHLGFFAKEYTPTYRGFDSHFGYYLGAADYWDHTAVGHGDPQWGLDLWRNMDPVRTEHGHYSTDLFTDEAVNVINQHNTSKPLFLYLAHQAVHCSTNSHQWLQAPDKYIKRVAHINDPDRRTFAAMTVALDDSVGKVIKTLTKRGMLKNSIVLFTSDNGGPTNHNNNNVASNWPLRGMKATLWEGGLRVPAFIWSPLIKSKPRVSDQLLHVTDWLPTLLNAVGAPVTNTSLLDGHNQWDTLSLDKPSVRNEIVHQIWQNSSIFSIRVKDFKLIAPNWAISRGRSGWYKPESVVSETLKFTPRENFPDTSSYSDSDSFFEDGLDFSSEIDEKYAKITEEELHVMLDRASAEYDIKNKNPNKLVVDCGPKPPDAATNCRPGAPCLYHIPSDPCEYKNLAKNEPVITKMIYKRMLEYSKTAVPSRRKDEDPRGLPWYNDGLWRPWVTLNE